MKCVPVLFRLVGDGAQNIHRCDDAADLFAFGDDDAVNAPVEHQFANTLQGFVGRNGDCRFGHNLSGGFRRPGANAGCFANDVGFGKDTNKLTGFFSLSNHLIAVRDPLARQMQEWRSSCASTIRLNSQVMNRGTPSMENELWNVNAQLLNGKMSPKDAAAKIQAGFAKWYAPQQNHAPGK